MKKPFLLNFLLVLLLACVTISCEKEGDDSSSDSPLVGTWTIEKFYFESPTSPGEFTTAAPNNYVVFREDGTFTHHEDEGDGNSDDYNGTYSYNETDKILTFTIEGDQEEDIWIVKNLTSSNLVLRTEAGDDIEEIYLKK